VGLGDRDQAAAQGGDGGTCLGASRQVEGNGVGLGGEVGQLVLPAPEGEPGEVARVRALGVLRLAPPEMGLGRLAQLGEPGLEGLGGGQVDVVELVPSIRRRRRAPDRGQRPVARCVRGDFLL
jgi:hypothetical protein